MNDAVPVDSSKNIPCPIKAEVLPLVHAKNLYFLNIFIFLFIFYRGYSIDVILQRPVSFLEEILENSECA